MNTNDQRRIIISTGVDISRSIVRLEREGWTMNSWTLDRTRIMSDYSTGSIYYLGIL